MVYLFVGVVYELGAGLRKGSRAGNLGAASLGKVN